MIPMLQKVAATGKIASSYIFVGSNLEALKREALEFSKRLNCLNQTGDSCSACKKIENKTHPDHYSIESEEGAIKIEILRDLKRRLHLKPYEGTYKVITIYGAEDLGTPGSNSLLKILEEPPSKTVFILTTPNLDRLLPTIVSRSHIIRMHQAILPPPSHELLPSLLSLPTSQIERFELAQKISEDDETFKTCLEILGAWYRSLLLSKEGLSPEGLSPAGLSSEGFSPDLVQTMAQKYSSEALLKKYDVVLKTAHHLRFQTHREIMAENLLLALSDPR